MSKASKPKQAAVAESDKSNKSNKATPPSTSDEQLQELFMDELKDIYWAENQLVKSLPVMIAATENAELISALTSHLDVTAVHVTRLEEIFTLLNEKVQAKKCDAMEGLTKEGEAVIEDTEPGTVARDTAIVTACRKVEHYEIAAYTSLHTLAGKLGLPDIAELLQQTLAEEQEADQNLSVIAESI